MRSLVRVQYRPPHWYEVPPFGAVFLFFANPAGDDVLDGGEGDDTLIAGDGDDFLCVSSA
ncbi:hypothetical protein [Candidatus Oscillochloris fontis]|uniref:hypothetical protein n=1 Tax=Candidatus Oscillochloris fontis TaxID=2496868 RepID=UPI003B82E7B7